jgi:hypothetical protein
VLSSYTLDYTHGHAQVVTPVLQADLRDLEFDKTLDHRK